MKNILLVGNWSSNTGYAWWLMEEFWAAIARKYRGQRRVYLCFPEVNNISSVLRNADIEIIEFDFDLTQPAKLSAKVKELSVDTLYLTDKRYLSPSYALLYLNGVKRIVIHDHTPGERDVPKGLKRLIKACCTRIPLLTASAYIAVSELGLKRLLNVALLTPVKCHLARNGIDIARFDAHEAKDLRTELHLSGDALVIASCSRVTKYKGIQHIIDAAATLLSGPLQENVFFVHCGDGPDLNEFVQRTKDLGIQDRFLFPGSRTDVQGLLKSADIAVHASSGEGLSLAILEFMAASLPVAVSDSPTVCQTIADGHSGLHFKTNDKDDLAAKLRLLIASKTLRRQLGSNARQAVLANYSLTKTIADVVAVFDRI